MSSQQNPPVFFPGTAFDVVGLATSAGGLAVLSKILSGLPVDFPAAIAIVQHLDPHSPNLLPSILVRRTALRVKQARAGEHLRAATVYVACPDRHLLINPDATLSLTDTTQVHFARPAADLLFESMAQSCQQRGIAVVLTGTGRDGATGIQKVKAMGA